MSNTDRLTLYELLPAIYRIDDRKAGAPLEALLSVIQEQADRIQDNIGQLYADLFIETCDEWAIPYIGDLVGNRPLHEVLRTRRADVARTLYYRRRKGTLPALEELARDVTGWAVHAVPFFESMVWTQNVNHRRNAGRTASIRDLQVMDLLNTPFERTAHSADIRQMSRAAGWYHPKGVGFFVWRLNNYHVEAAMAAKEAAPNGHGFHFSPFALATRLFQRPEDLPAGVLTEERHVRQPIRPAAFFAAAAAFYDPTVTPSAHRRDGIAFSAALPAIPMDLSAFAQPPVGSAGIDTARGLISFAAAGIPAQAAVSYLGGKPKQAEQLALPNNHVFRFALLNLDIRHDAALVPVANIRYMDLSSWTRPAAGAVGVDLGLGRVSFPVGQEPSTDVEFRFDDGAFVIARQAGPPNAHGFLLRLPANPASLRIVRDGAPLAAFQLFCMKLGTWKRPPAQRVGVDVELGRITFPAGEEPVGAAVVSYDYGFPADLGGGPYDRLAPVKPGETVDTLAARALRDPKGFHKDAAALALFVGEGGFAKIDDALTKWRADGRPNCTVTIQDSRTYAENLNFDVGAKALVVQAAQRCRPAIVGAVASTGGAGTASLLLSGLWIQSGLQALGNLKELTITHCSIGGSGPGPIVVAPSNRSVRVAVDRSIAGNLVLPADSTLSLRDSITRGIQSSGVVSIERSTVFGAATLREIGLISESILTGKVDVMRRQSGCVRYSSLPSTSQTPRRYQCQPDLALDGVPAALQAAAELRVTPAFTSGGFGNAAYAQLSPACPIQISAGAEDGGEMGAYQFLQQGRRAANLRLRLNEYLPFGPRAEILYVS